MLGRIDAMTRAKVQSIDELEAKIMITDEKLNIIYINPAVRAFLQTIEAELRKELPRFSMQTLVGSNIDIFHRHPAHQRKRAPRPSRIGLSAGWLTGQKAIWSWSQPPNPPQK